MTSYENLIGLNFHIYVDTLNIFPQSFFIYWNSFKKNYFLFVSAVLLMIIVAGSTCL